MEECFKCGISEDKVLLFDAICDEGVMKICSKCSEKEDIPIIRKPTESQLRDSERRRSIYERLSGKQIEPVRKEKLKIERTPTSMRELVDRSYTDRAPKKREPRPDLIDNFHWVIMRARRSKKISQAQLAKEIDESEAAIKMAEQGILPKDDYILVNKLERNLGIKLIRKEAEEVIKKIQPPKKLSFDPFSSRRLTIGDLKEMKQKHESEILDEKERIWPEHEDFIEEDFEEEM